MSLVRDCHQDSRLKRETVRWPAEDGRAGTFGRTVAGRLRGGDSQVVEIEHSEGAPFALLALFDRIDHPARGRDGGSPGAAGRVALANGRALKGKGKGKQIVPAGERLVLELPGGGGLGDAEPE